MARNVWLHRLALGDIFHDDDMALPNKGAIIVRRIRDSKFFKEAEDDLPQIIEELEDAAKEDDVDWFDMVWNAFYDWADANRVWVETISTK